MRNFDYTKMQFVHNYDRSGFNPKGGTTFAYRLENINGKDCMVIGISYCSKYDEFCRSTGRKYAENYFNEVLMNFNNTDGQHWFIQQYHTVYGMVLTPNKLFNIFMLSNPYLIHIDNETDEKLFELCKSGEIDFSTIPNEILCNVVIPYAVAEVFETVDEEAVEVIQYDDDIN